jgi:prolyl 3-hydroxylase /prolyl 3,4-dihydroxylase
MNKVYLQPRTISSLSQRFTEESSLELYSFLSPALATKLDKGLREMDAREALSSSTRGGARVPPHSAGTGRDWRVTGPPHKWRYCTLVPPPTPSQNATITRPRAAQTPIEIVRSLQDELFASAAFRAWLAALSRLVPLRHTARARRFRPGLDYTLATSEDKEARLDVVLNLTPDSVKSAEETDGAVGWQSGDWGGWEVNRLVFFFLLVSDCFHETVLHGSS